MEQYGPDIQVAELRAELAKSCERLGSMQDLCGAYYVGLLEWKKQPYGPELTTDKSRRRSG